MTFAFLFFSESLEISIYLYKLIFGFKKLKNASNFLLLEVT